MFGRRSKRVEGGDAHQEGSEPAVSRLLAEDAPRAGADAGLAAIESEFAFSDHDRSLLDGPTIDLAHLPLPQSAIDATVAEHRSRLDDVILQLNTEWAERLGHPTSLRPYLMLPEKCWENDHRETMVDLLGLAPTQLWNVLPLPCDPSTASSLGLPLHPGLEAAEIARVAGTFVDEAIEQMQASFERATFAGDAVDTEALDQARAKAVADIQALSLRMGHAVLGEDAVERTRARFFSSSPESP